ncbi:DNA gyrase inhibitor YacG [Magnetospirillum sulfuroxidans]|uniref:DNA gyrase inhibitor YacG n=1 Tax=Magnetospirillum sulfuroxidans TaxID=611300 RepID=A0ABS5I911_9PROT|nr:DNA gyrase inhibitor YacG [Magnetospirillum sulfuroxidans]MBR9970896.1 DNA gyrase inhibitor YacG [Magnetospirillum sulfuroxidans]
MQKPANSNKPCPVCGKPPHPDYTPFCSTRCADVDLNRWLGGVYRVQTNEIADDPDGAEQS